MKHKNFDNVYPYGYFLIRKSDNMKYVGMRYGNVKKNLTPNQDFGKVYFTSGRLKKEFKKNPENFYFRIVNTFDEVEELFAWELKVAYRIYKRPDWANQSWGQNYGDNPEIGRLISEGRSRVGNDGLSSSQRGASKLKDWIWNTEDGEKWREDISTRISKMRSEYSPEREREIQEKRKTNMDFYKASAKAQQTMKIVGEDGLNSLQRKAKKAAESLKLSGKSTELAKERDFKYTKKLGEMSEEEFISFCSGKSKRTVSGAVTRRNKYLKLIGVE